MCPIIIIFLIGTGCVLFIREWEFVTVALFVPL